MIERWTRTPLRHFCAAGFLLREGVRNLQRDGDVQDEPAARDIDRF